MYCVFTQGLLGAPERSVYIMETHRSRRRSVRGSRSRNRSRSKRIGGSWSNSKRIGGAGVGAITRRGSGVTGSEKNLGTRRQRQTTTDDRRRKTTFDAVWCFGILLLT